MLRLPQYDGERNIARLEATRYRTITRLAERFDGPRKASVRAEDGRNHENGVPLGHRAFERQASAQLHTETISGQGTGGRARRDTTAGKYGASTAARHEPSKPARTANQVNRRAVYEHARCAALFKGHCERQGAKVDAPYVGDSKLGKNCEGLGGGN